MVDIVTPSVVTMSTIDTGAEPTGKSQKAKPEKPDESKYKEDLSKAEKEHAAAQEKMVSLSPFSGSKGFNWHFFSLGNSGDQKLIFLCTE